MKEFTRTYGTYKNMKNMQQHAEHFTTTSNHSAALFVATAHTAESAAQVGTTDYIDLSEGQQNAYKFAFQNQIVAYFVGRISVGINTQKE